METTDKLFHFFDSKFPFNTEGLEEFIASFETKKYKKGEIILKESQTEKELRFLDKGIIREYYASYEREININFYVKSEFVNDFSSLTKETQTKKNQECLSEVELRCLPKSKFNIFLTKYSCGKVFIDTIFQRIIEKKEQEEYDLLTKSSEELYLELLKNKADWLQNIPQYHIASYLKITPETLSRIRKRI